ncbi:MAG: metal-sulfur cluster assembly factor [Planctomycetota bacterium]|nr:MAG: metal-sulfur cluster assembly factor [Planctomycetota bacterium]
MPAFDDSEHTNSVPDKLRLLQAAFQSGRFDLGMSLAESIKETLRFERQVQSPAEEPVVAADRAIAVGELPGPWADWARGWKHCRVLDLFETVGIERRGEPVDLAWAVLDSQATDLGRELRVARLDSAKGTLHELPSQVYAESRGGGQRRCRLVFAADVPAHGQATYFVFHDNPHAERPDYTTDLHTAGEGYRLDIDNRHYQAQLSRQSGQLERLIYKRQHGLELYAGGKGHGEPPGIDWAHDYVDRGGFQKLRMRNWAECPNYEVVRGPLCVQVRRWGFPHSPIHPVFTPSRIHMDQTYTFYAALPYFFKQSRFDVVADVDIEAMRDDEWVLSGYSFTDLLWIDAQGKIHEGPVPASEMTNLWGVGFYHAQSRDAFVALWLEHEGDGVSVSHGGAPTLHYDGHGQLWSRYPAERTSLKAGTSLRQRNAYLVSPYETEGGDRQIEQLRHRLLHPCDARAGEPPRVDAKSTVGTLARFGETRDTAPLKSAIWEALRGVRDEQLYTIDANVVDMGYVYDVRERDGVVTVVVTMPHRGRPVIEFLESAGGGRVDEGIRERVARIAGVRDVLVEATWNPAWSVSRLTDAGRRALGLDA